MGRSLSPSQDPGHQGHGERHPEGEELAEEIAAEVGRVEGDQHACHGDGACDRG